MSPLDQRRLAGFAALTLAGTAPALLILTALLDTGAAGWWPLSTIAAVSGVDAGARAALLSLLTVAAAFAVVLLRHRRTYPNAQTRPDRAGYLEPATWAAVTFAAVTAAGALVPTAAALPVASVVSGWWLAHRLRTWWQVPAELLPDPQVGQIWWALVPFEDTTEAKDRPALVVARGKRSATVLMFTSQDKSGRGGYVPVPPHVWRQPRRSFLKTDRRIRVRLEDFRRPEGNADPGTLTAAGLTR